MLNPTSEIKIKPKIVAVSPSELTEGEDFYINDSGFFVFMKAYHLKRGFCCESGCRHCPYGFKKKISEP